MMPHTTEVLPPERPQEPVASDEPVGIVNPRDPAEHGLSGWNPYEVWRTRVKSAGERSPDRSTPLKWPAAVTKA